VVRLIADRLRPFGQVPFGQVPFGQVPFGQVPMGPALLLLHADYDGLELGEGLHRVSTADATHS
jgi:hypothetical protein